MVCVWKTTEKEGIKALKLTISEFTYIMTLNLAELVYSHSSISSDLRVMALFHCLDSATAR